MKARQKTLTKLSEPEKVDAYMQGLKHPLKSGFLEGDDADGRRLALFFNMKDVKSKQALLQAVIRRWLETLDMK